MQVEASEDPVSHSMWVAAGLAFSGVLLALAMLAQGRTAAARAAA